MKILLSKRLLRFLIGKGYRFCLSKTQSPSGRNKKVSITLTPVKARPQLRQLPVGYDTYFNIVLEPVQMTAGIDDTAVMVEVDRDTFIGYIKSLLKPTISKLTTV